MGTLCRSAIFLLLVLGTSGPGKAEASLECAGKKPTSKLFCYYSKLQDVNSCRCSHVILPADADVKSIDRVREQLKGTKILITVNEFNQGLVEILKKSKLDGVELSLTKLDSKNDISDFISTVRTKLGSDLKIVLSVPANSEVLAKYYDFKALSKQADLFVLQTAFLGANTNVTFHPSRLSGLWDMQNTDSVVDLVSGLGAPLSKLVITSPVQAFKFRLQDEKMTAPGSPALEVESIDRDQLCRTMKNGRNWTLERDQDQSGPYIFSKDEWIAFEDAMSIDIKAKYSRVRGLAGMALMDLSQDGGTECESAILDAAFAGLSKQARAPRGAVLHSLEREILETPARKLDSVQVSPYRISRVIDVEGNVHSIRQDTRTEFECARQGYYVHPRSCNRFYRCVKFDQLTEDFNVFEFDCPSGLAFDEKVEVCVWPGSLPKASACSGSSEIAPVPRQRFICPNNAGYYADPENCRWFFACLDHGKSPLSAYEFRCPYGLVFDESRLLCEWPWLVPRCGSGFAFGTDVGGGDGIEPLNHYRGLGVLVNTALGGLQGPIQQQPARVYSNVGITNGNLGVVGILPGGVASEGQYQDHSGIGLAQQALRNSQLSFHGGTGSIGGNQLNGQGGSIETGSGGASFSDALRNNQINIQAGGTSGGSGSSGTSSNFGQFDGVVGQNQIGNGLNIVGGTITNSDANLINGLAFDGGLNLNPQQGFVQFNSNGGSVYSGAVGTAGNINIIGGGYSAVGVVDSGIEITNNGADTNTISVTSSPASVTSVSSVPAVTSVPVPSLSAISGFQSFSGGVVANVPELQYRVKSGLSIANISTNFVNFVSTTPASVFAAGYAYPQTEPIVRTTVVQQPISSAGYAQGFAQPIVSTIENGYQKKSTLEGFPFSRPGLGFEGVTFAKAGLGGSYSYQSFDSVHQGGSVAQPVLQQKFVQPAIRQYARPVVQSFVQPAVQQKVVQQYAQNVQSVVQPKIVEHYVQPVVEQKVVQPVVQQYVQPTVQPKIVEHYVQPVVQQKVVQQYVQPTVQPQIVQQYVQPVVQQKVLQPVIQQYVPSTAQPKVVEHYVQSVVQQKAVQPVIQQYVQPTAQPKIVEHYVQPAVRQKVVQPVVQEYVQQVQPKIVEQYLQPVVQQQYVQPTQPAISVSSFQKHDSFSGYQQKQQEQKQEVFTGYQYSKPAVAFEVAAPQVDVSSYNVPSSTVRPQVYVSTTQRPQGFVSSTLAAEGFVSTTQTPHGFVSSTPSVPVQPAVSTSSFTGYNYQKPSIAFEEGPQIQITTLKPRGFVSSTTYPVVEQKYVQPISIVKPQVSTVRPIDIFVPSTVTPVVQQNVVQRVNLAQPVSVTTFTQNHDRFEGYDYPKPSVAFEERPQVYSVPSTTPRPQIYVSSTVQPVVEQKIYVQQQQPVVEQKFVQPVSVVQEVPKPAISVATFTQNHENFEGYNYPKPTVAFEERPVYSVPSSTPRPQVFVPSTVVPLEQPKFIQAPVEHPKFIQAPVIETKFVQQLPVAEPVRPAISVSTFTQKHDTFRGYEYSKPSIAFEEQPQVYAVPSTTPRPRVYLPPSTVAPAVQTVIQQKVVQPVIEQKFVQPLPIVEPVKPVISVATYQKQDTIRGYDYPKPAVAFEERPRAQNAVSTYNFQNVVQQAFAGREEAQQDYEEVQPIQPVQPIRRPAVVSSYSYTAPAKTFETYEQIQPIAEIRKTVVQPIAESVTYRPVQPVVETVTYRQPVIQTYTPAQPVAIKKPVAISSYSYTAPAQPAQPIYETVDYKPVEPVIVKKPYSYIPPAKPTQTYLPVEPAQPRNQPAVVSSFSFTANSDNTNKYVEQAYQNRFQGYAYPKPSVEFAEEPYFNQQPVEEVPFTKKNAYVTGGQSFQYKQQNFANYHQEQVPVVSSTTERYQPVVVENYRAPDVVVPSRYQPAVVTSTTPRYEPVVIPSTTERYEPLVIENYEAPRRVVGQQQQQQQFYSEINSGYAYDKPEIRFEEAPTPKARFEAIVSTAQPVTTSRPIVRYSFSSLDDYAEVSTRRPYLPPQPARVKAYTSTTTEEPYIVPEISKEYLPVTTPAREYLPVTTPSREYIPVTTQRVIAVPTREYLPVTTERVVVTPIREYLPVVKTRGRARARVTTTTEEPSNEYLPAEEEVPSREYLPVRSRFRVTTSTEQPEQDILVSSRRPVKVLKVVRPKTIVKTNDFHPLLPAKLGAQCTCTSNTVRLNRKKPLRIVVEEGDDDDDDGYAVQDSNEGVIVENYNYEPQRTDVVDITPVPLQAISSTAVPLIASRRQGYRDNAIIIEPVSESIDVLVRPTTSPAVRDKDIVKAVRTGLKLVKQAAREGAEEGASAAIAASGKAFDRYGPGGVRSRNERLQGTVDCQRAGLFRHPTQCNKFYSCRWDCTKNRFTLHVFNCPVHLTFDNTLGACNWPSQGPACLENTLLPSD